MTAERAQKIASDEVPGVEWVVSFIDRATLLLLGKMPDGKVAGGPLEVSEDFLFRHEEGARVRRAACDLAMAWCDGALRCA